MLRIESADGVSVNITQEATMLSEYLLMQQDDFDRDTRGRPSIVLPMIDGVALRVICSFLEAQWDHRDDAQTSKWFQQIHTTLEQRNKLSHMQTEVPAWLQAWIDHHFAITITDSDIKMRQTLTHIKNCIQHATVLGVASLVDVATWTLAKQLAHARDIEFVLKACKATLV